MAEKRDILWRFLGDAKDLNRATKDAQKGLGGVQGSMGKLGKAAGALGLAFGASEVLQFAGDAVTAAISAEEAASKFETVFGASETAASGMETFADKAGVARDRAQDLFGTLGNLTQAQGFSRDAAAEFTDKVAILAGDLASFNDQDPAQVFEELGLAMVTTERDSLKKYGIAIGETEVKQRALNLAIEDGRDEATQYDRAIASYEIAMEQAGSAVGDLDRTVDSAANRMRQLGARMRDIKVQVGRALIPSTEVALEFAESLIEVADAASTGEEKLLGFAGAVGTVGGQLARLPGIDQVLVNPLSRVLDTVENNIPVLGTFVGKVRDVNDAITGAGEAAGTSQEILAEWIPLSSQIEDAVTRSNDNMERSQDDLTRAIEGTMRAEQVWSEADAREKIRRQYELIAAAGGAGVDRLTRQESIARQGGINQHAGGTIVGNQLAMLRHGERVTNPGQPGHDGGSIVVNFNGVVGDPMMVAEQIADLITTYQRTNGQVINGLSG